MMPSSLHAKAAPTITSAFIRTTRQLSDSENSQTIAGVATALLQACQPTWKAYAKQVIANARTLADELVAHDYKLQTNGTDTHLVLWDLRPLKLTGSKLEKLCDLLGITINSKGIRPRGT